MKRFSRQRTALGWLAICIFCPLFYPALDSAADLPPRGLPQQQVVENSAEAVRVDNAPRLDGTLDDPLWQAATTISDFRQREPYEGASPTEKTEVRILYTRHAVYFGLHCYDSKPSAIVATELRRDVNQDLDDHFEIMIDSNFDRRGAYVFQINPLGTQMDGLIVEEHGDINTEADFDPGWDGVWTSEARITSDGWTATVEIPFKTLNFKRSDNVIWGLNFKRFIRRKNEQDLWRAYQRRFGLTKVSQAGVLNGIHEIGSGRLFIVKPYALAQYDKQTGQDPKFPLTGGLDVKYGLTSKLILNLTGNTDFADTDVDLEPFNITPFKVFIPEKRPFFLENAGVFSFPMGDQDQLFFSRNIGIDPVTGQQVPINGGAKLTGAIGRTEIGVLDVDTRSSGPNPYSNVGVVRVKESLWGGSYIGAMAIDKRSGNVQDPFNQTGGVDTRLVYKDWFLDAHMAGTRSTGEPSGASDVGATLYYRSNWLDGIFDRRKIGPNFNPEVGFIERVDSNETYGDLTFKVRPQISGVRELQFEGFLLHAPDTRGQVSTQEWQNTFRAEFNNGGYTDDDIVDVFTQRIIDPFHIYKNVFIPPGVYHFTRHQLTYGSGKDRRFTYNFFERFGGYYGGTLNEFRVRANYRPNTKFSFSASETWDRFRLPLPNGHFSVVLASLQGNYSFNRFLTFTSLLQMDTSNTQAVSANLRLRYNYRPDSDLYLIYNIGTQFASIAPANPPQVRETRIAVKWTYSFAP